MEQKRGSVASEREVGRRGDESAVYSPGEEMGKQLGGDLDVGLGAERNILEDMDKFQRELDELREKYEKKA